MDQQLAAEAGHDPRESQADLSGADNPDLFTVQIEADQPMQGEVALASAVERAVSASVEGHDQRQGMFGDGMRRVGGHPHHRQAECLRGVQVDVVTGEHLTVDNTLKNLTVSRLRELDVVIATPGTLEKLLLMPVPVWRSRIEFLLDHFAENAPASLRVLFVAVPELSKIVRMPRLLGWAADRSARALNQALEASCAARPYVDFVPFRPTERSGRDGTGRTYQHWASLIAPRVALALDQHQKVSQ